MEWQQDLFDNAVDDRLQRLTKPFDSLKPGRYIFETTPENKGDYIKREISIEERDGELGCYMRLMGNFIKVRDFRNDCSLTLMEEA